MLALGGVLPCHSWTRYLVSGLSQQRFNFASIPRHWLNQGVHLC
jgi:hypothetical protein